MTRGQGNITTNAPVSDYTRPSHAVCHVIAPCGTSIFLSFGLLKVKNAAFATWTATFFIIFRGVCTHLSRRNNNFFASRTIEGICMEIVRLPVRVSQQSGSSVGNPELATANVALRSHGTAIGRSLTFFPRFFQRRIAFARLSVLLLHVLPVEFITPGSIACCYGRGWRGTLAGGCGRTIEGICVEIVRLPVRVSQQSGSSVGNPELATANVALRSHGTAIGRSRTFLLCFLQRRIAFARLSVLLLHVLPVEFITPPRACCCKCVGLVMQLQVHRAFCLQCMWPQNQSGCNRRHKHGWHL